MKLQSAREVRFGGTSRPGIGKLVQTRKAIWLGLVASALVMALAACSEPGGAPEQRDTTPNAFAFDAVANVEPGTMVTSSAITVEGINAPAPITVSSGATLLVNGSTFTGSTVMQGQQVAVRLQASGEYSTTVSAEVTIGGVSGRFSVTTRAEPGADTTPDAFSFLSLTDQELDTVVESNSITIRGIDAPAPLVVDGPATLLVNGAESTADTAVNGQEIRLRIRTSNEFESTVSATLTVGGVSSIFSVTTKAEPPTILVTNLNDSGPGSLRQAILDANNGTRIAFQAGLSGLLTLTSQVLIDKSIEIDGPGSNVITITGDLQNRLFYVDRPASGDSVSVTIRDLTLAEGSIAGTVDNSGGAILVAQDVTLRLEQVVVRDSAASQSGGAILNRGLLLLGGSQILNNTASGSNGGGGAIYNSGELRATDSIISNNRSVNNTSGGIYSSGPVSLTRTEISANSSASVGGALVVENATLDVVDSFIHSNNANGHGGALYAYRSDVTIRNGSRINNNMVLASGRGSGGAIYAYQGTLEISDSELLNNQAPSSSTTVGGQGGALYLYAVTEPTVSRSRFEGNSARRRGGAISLDGAVQIEIGGSEFVSNASQYGGAISYAAGSSAANYLIMSSTFASNTAQTAGGALYWYNRGQGQIRNSTFTSNTVSNGPGGAIWTNRALIVIEATIARNQASGLGDGIMATSLTLRNSIVALNGDSDIAGLTNPVTSQGYNLIGDGTDTGMVNGRGGDIVGSSAAPIDPLLDVLADNGGPTRTMALLPGSPAIGHIPAGSNFSIADQRGLPRPGTDGVSDIGAYESQ